MIAVANRIQVAPEHAEAFERRFQERAGHVDDSPGFLRNQVLRPTREGDPYVVLSLWESREAFDAWTRSDAFRRAHAGASGASAGSSSALEIHEVIQDTDQPGLRPAPLDGAVHR
jgi:heme-degrading monooxygenase HmoA